MGQKRPFTLTDIQQLEQYLRRQENWHDLALLGTALDTLLRASDLLALTVADVQGRTGQIHVRLPQRQRKTQVVVMPVLT